MTRLLIAAGLALYETETECYVSEIPESPDSTDAGPSLSIVDAGPDREGGVP
jgi:hypothetical protein